MKLLPELPARVIEDSYPSGVTLAYLPPNQAWAVLWGTGPLSERSVLRVFNSRKEASAYADELLDPPTYTVGQSDEY